MASTEIVARKLKWHDHIMAYYFSTVIFVGDRLADNTPKRDFIKKR